MELRQLRYFARADVRVHLVEALSGHLANMLNARQFDLAVLFGADAGRRWSVTPLLDEKRYAIGAASLAGMPRGPYASIADLAGLPLSLPSNTHGLRSLIDTSFVYRGSRRA